MSDEMSDEEATLLLARRGFSPEDRAAIQRDYGIVDDLSWLRRVVGKSVDDEAKQRFRAQNVALLDAIEAEIGRRGES